MTQTPQRSLVRTRRWRELGVGIAGTVAVLSITRVFGLAAGLVAATGGLSAAFVYVRRFVEEQRESALDIDSLLFNPRTIRRKGASDDEGRLLKNARREVDESVQRCLRLARTSMRAQTACVLWVNSAQNAARIRQIETCSDGIAWGEVPDRSGILALIRKNPQDPTIANGIGGTAGSLPWYRNDAQPHHAIGIAIRHEGTFLGYFVVDRGRGGRPFDEVDAETLRELAALVVSQMHMETVLLSAETVRTDMMVLDAAAAQLNQALRIDDVCTTALNLLARFASFETFVVTAVDEKDGSQSVMFASGPGADAIPREAFPIDDSIAWKVIRRREVLPYKNVLETPNEAIFGPGGSLPEARALAVFPLHMAGQILGTLTIASQFQSDYSQLGNQFQILLHHIAAALSNALAYDSAYRLATIDGKTNLLNHMAFKERAVEAIARASRSGRSLCVVMTDIDHFKKVNDTWGHSIGDVVIRAVAEVIRASVRNVDLASRFGGEEFVVLMEDTELDAALRMAERLRTTVEQRRFETGDTEFQVTISLGVARLAPGASLDEVMEAADLALYDAKRGGRNQTVVAATAPSAAAET